MYGGQFGGGNYQGAQVSSDNANTGVDEVHILSLPSFMWFKAN